VARRFFRQRLAGCTNRTDLLGSDVDLWPTRARRRSRRRIRGPTKTVSGPTRFAVTAGLPAGDVRAAGTTRTVPIQPPVPAVVPAGPGSVAAAGGAVQPNISSRLSTSPNSSISRTQYQPSTNITRGTTRPRRPRTTTRRAGRSRRRRANTACRRTVDRVGPGPSSPVWAWAPISTRTRKTAVTGVSGCSSAGRSCGESNGESREPNTDQFPWSPARRWPYKVLKIHSPPSHRSVPPALAPGCTRPGTSIRVFHFTAAPPDPLAKQLRAGASVPGCLI